MNTPPESPAAAAPARPRGRGRPAKDQPPQTNAQAKLGRAVQDAEKRRDAAAAAYKISKTVAAELQLLQLELEVSTAWSAYLRSTGDHTAALKYAEISSKMSGRVAALRELAATDLLAELAGRARREQDVARRVGVR